MDVDEALQAVLAELETTLAGYRSTTEHWRTRRQAAALPYLRGYEDGLLHAVVRLRAVLEQGRAGQREEQETSWP